MVMHSMHLDLMLNVKKGSCEYHLLSLLVRLDEEIGPWSTDYEAAADALITRPRAERLYNKIN